MQAKILNAARRQFAIVLNSSKMTDEADAESPTEDQSFQSDKGLEGQESQGATAIPASSKKQAFDDVMTPLTAAELSDPGAQKVILYMLNEAKSENARLEGFVERFHDADKRASVLQEQLISERKTSRSTDIAFGVGTGLGGALAGAGYFLWSKTPPQTELGWFFVVTGLFLLVGGALVKFAKR